MLTVHHALAFLVIGVCLLATVFALVAYRTRGGAGALVTHMLALAQTLIVAQAAVGLLLLADHRRADKGVHYMYGSLAVLAVAFFVYLMWRERRGEIESWSTRERVVFYGAALLIVAAIGLYFWHGLPGYEQLGFLGVVVGAGYAMFRVWRGRHSYS